MATVEHLLWVDLETTGLDETADEIIEIGAILTDYDLNVAAELDTLVAPTRQGWQQLSANHTVARMHSTSGLLAAVDTAAADGTAPTTAEAEAAMIDWLADHNAQPGHVALAGSGVAHLDMRFLRRHMPALVDWLHYWLLDIGVIRRAHHMWVGEHLTDINGDKTHRALDDIRCHLTEARTFRQTWQARWHDGHPRKDRR